MPSRFVRVKKRTVRDIHENMLQPRLKTELYGISQKVTDFARRNHVFQNRTGALEGSISWEGPKRTRTGYSTTIFAGGWSVVKYAFNFALRKGTGRRRRNVRYQPRKSGQPLHRRRLAPRRGQGVYVDYAPYVEDRGYWVLSGAIRHFRRKIGTILGLKLKAIRI